MAYTNDQIWNAIQASQSQGYSLNDIISGAGNMGISNDQLLSAWNQYNTPAPAPAPVYAPPPPPVAPAPSIADNNYMDYWYAQQAATRNEAPAPAPTPAPAPYVPTYSTAAQQSYAGSTPAEPVMPPAPAPQMMQPQAAAAPSISDPNYMNWFTQQQNLSRPISSQYSNDQLWNAVQSSLGQGFSMDDIKNKAASAYGINGDQFNSLLSAYGYNPPAPAPVTSNASPVTNTTTPSADSQPDWLKNFNTNGEGEYYDAATKRSYVPIYGMGHYEGMDNYVPGALTGYRGYNFDPAVNGGKSELQFVGTPYDTYDASGNKTGTGNWTEDDLGGGFGGLLNNPGMGALSVLMLPFAVGGLQAALGAGAAGAGEAAGAVGGAGGFIGEGAASGIPAWDAAAGIGGLETSAMGAGAADLGGVFNPAVDSQLANSTLGLDAYAGSVPSAVDLGSAGGVINTGAVGGVLPGGGGSTVSSVFNPAKDSQAYNNTVGNSTALGGYQNPAATPGTVTLSNGGPGGTSYTGNTMGPTIPGGGGGSGGGTTTTGTKPPVTGVPGGGAGTGSGSGGSGVGLGGLGGLLGIASLLTQIAGERRHQEAADRMTTWLNEQMDKVDALYSPGSPEYNQMKQEMERKDAAAGRNSQYGPRAVNLAAKITETKANNKARMVPGIASAYASALNQNADAYAALPALLSAAAGSTGGNVISGGIDGITNIIKSIFGGSSSSGTNSITNTGNGIDPTQIAQIAQYLA